MAKCDCILLYSNRILLKLLTNNPELNCGIWWVSRALSKCLLFVCENWTSQHIAAGDTYTCLLHRSSAIISQYSHADILHCLPLIVSVRFKCLSELWVLSHHMHAAHGSCIIHLHWYSALLNRPLTPETEKKKPLSSVHTQFRCAFAW